MKDYKYLVNRPEPAPEMPQELAYFFLAMAVIGWIGVLLLI